MFRLKSENASRETGGLVGEAQELEWVIVNILATALLLDIMSGVTMSIWMNDARVECDIHWQGVDYYVTPASLIHTITTGER